MTTPLLKRVVEESLGCGKFAAVVVSPGVVSTLSDLFSSTSLHNFSSLWSSHSSSPLHLNSMSMQHVSSGLASSGTVSHENI